MHRTRSAGRAVFTQMNRPDEGTVDDLLGKISLALQTTGSLPKGMQVNQRSTPTRDGGIRFYVTAGGGTMRVIPVQALSDLNRNLNRGFTVHLVTGQQAGSPVIYVDYDRGKATRSMPWPAKPVGMGLLSLTGMLWSSWMLWTRYMEYESVFGRLWT